MTSLSLFLVLVLIALPLWIIAFRTRRDDRAVLSCMLQINETINRHREKATPTYGPERDNLRAITHLHGDLIPLHRDVERIMLPWLRP